MIRPRLLLTGYRAYGDWIFTCPVLPFLFDRYEVFCDMNLKGDHLFYDDPRFSGKAVFIFENNPPSEFARLADERRMRMREQVKPDHEIDLSGTLEGACIARPEQPEFSLPVADRRVVYGSHGFYDAVFQRCGIPVPDALDLRGLWYPDEAYAWGTAWEELQGDRFVVVMVIHGSSIHKRFRDWRLVMDQILQRYPEALIYLTGEEKPANLPAERVRWLSHLNMGFKQTALLVKHVDLVIGPETGLLVAAGMWGTPKIMLMSASSVWQANQYQRGDFSFQLPPACSPCHLSVFQIADCENAVEDGETEKVPACVAGNVIHQIMERVSYVHRNLRRKLPSKVS